MQLAHLVIDFKGSGRVLN